MMQVLHDVVKAGYVRYIGTSSCYAWQFQVMQKRQMFPTLNHFGVGIIPWSTLARGLLIRPFKTDGVTTRGNTDTYTTKYLEGAGTQEIVNRSPKGGG
ncbi:hypothetical protein EDB92DRAFT_1830281 [Lactarius akahatsu]|uniref:NADP-dependent oxidoreductase domain-containing protein n=1 Tax=Lactarius akahatsu TaxID=416441 RepID=A0AAD4LUH2_9AGAM|nr:hypothetical protein EDB92DRAFT_1830281 [Lactarius akahatsu]